MKKIFVTGAGGFAGGIAARYLTAKGFDVTAQTRKSEVVPPAGPIAGQFEIIKSDLSDLSRAPRRIDAVVHTAAASTWPGVAIEDVTTENLKATQAVLEYALKSGAQTLIFYSSLSVFGKVSQPLLNEQTPRTNPDAYGSSKYLSEMLLKAHSDEMPSVALRLPGVVGGGARRCFVAETWQRIKKGETVRYFHPDKPYNNLILAEDIARFAGHLIQSDIDRHEMLVLAAAGQTTYRQAVQMMINASNSRSEIQIEETSRPSYLVDTTKAEKNFGFSPSDVTTSIHRLITENP